MKSILRSYKGLTGLLACAVVLTGYASGISRHEGPDLQGAWEGVMHLWDDAVASGETAKTRIVLKLVRTNGTYHATTDWIDWGRSNVPMGKVIYAYPSLQIVRLTNDVWKLTVNKHGSAMTLEHQIRFIIPDPVVLKRTTMPTPVPTPLAEADFAPRVGSDLQGYWKGEFGSNALPVGVKIAEPATGIFRAEYDNPMAGIVGRPTSVVYKQGAVKLRLATGAGMFQGVLNSNRTEMSGAWIQNSDSLPLTLKQADCRAEHVPEAEKDYTAHSENDPSGHWKGTWSLTIGDNVPASIRFALDIAKLPDGSRAATLARIDELGGNDGPMPASEFQYDPPNIHATWKAYGGSYKGTLEDGKLVGAWEYGGGGWPLVFERSKQ